MEEVSSLMLPSMAIVASRSLQVTRKSSRLTLGRELLLWSTVKSMKEQQSCRARTQSVSFPYLVHFPADILTRFAAINLDEESKIPGYSKMIEALALDEKPRRDFLMACLLKLGLQVNQENTSVPSLSRLHLSSLLPEGTSEVMEALHEIITEEDGEEYIKDENDTFHLEIPSAWSLGSVSEALSKTKTKKTNEGLDSEDRIVDYSTIVKRLVVHGKDLPPSKETPYFNHHAFFANLQHYQAQAQGTDTQSSFGKTLMYGEVVTSTNTMLEK